MQLIVTEVSEPITSSELMGILAVDIGNTNTKLQINTRQVITLNNSKLISSSQISELILTDSILLNIKQAKRLAYSSVVNDDLTKHILTQILQVLDLTDIQLQRWSTPKILQLALPGQHQQLGHLGSDRALRIYYLSHLNTARYQIGIGCGTAFTIEVVYQQELIESLILPGLSTQLNSLTASTAKLPAIAAHEVSQILTNATPLSTNHAIVSGITGAYLSLIDNLYRRYAPENLIACGGYAELLSATWQNLQLAITPLRFLETQVLTQLCLSHWRRTSN